MAPDSAGTNVFLGNMAGSMSPRGVRGVLGPREEDTVPGAIDFLPRRRPRKTAKRPRRWRAERCGSAFWRPGRSHEINVYNCGLKIGLPTLQHVLASMRDRVRIRRLKGTH